VNRPKQATGDAALADPEPVLAALHEMRSATLAIDAILSLIRGRTDAGPAAAREPLLGELDLLRRSARRVDRLLAILHPLIKAGSDAVPIDVTDVLVGEVAAAELEAGWRRVGLCLAPGAAPVEIPADPALLRALVRGLLAAAIRAADAETTLTVAASRSAAGAAIEIAGASQPPSGVDDGLCSALAARLGGRLRWRPGESGGTIAFEIDGAVAAEEPPR
jgi:signal transduction histidine kinase